MRLPKGSLRFPLGGTLAHPFLAMNHTQPPKLYNDWNLNITPKWRNIYLPNQNKMWQLFGRLEFTAPLLQVQKKWFLLKIRVLKLYFCPFFSLMLYQTYPPKKNVRTPWFRWWPAPRFPRIEGCQNFHHRNCTQNCDHRNGSQKKRGTFPWVFQMGYPKMMLLFFI